MLSLSPSYSLLYLPCPLPLLRDVINKCTEWGWKSRRHTRFDIPSHHWSHRCEGHIAHAPNCDFIAAYERMKAHFYSRVHLGCSLRSLHPSIYPYPLYQPNEIDLLVCGARGCNGRTDELKAFSPPCPIAGAGKETLQINFVSRRVRNLSQGYGRNKI